MNTYATLQDLIDRFGEREIEQLTSRMAMDVIDNAAVTRAVADAGDEIDCYLAVRYTLPLRTVPPLVCRLTCDVARYRLYDDAATEEVRRRYDDAVSLLERLAAGTALLPQLSEEGHA